MPMGNPYATMAQPNNNQDAQTPYKARVVDNNDPNKQRRVKIRVRELHRNWPVDTLPWAALEGNKGGHAAIGSIHLPRKGEYVWVRFDDNNGNSPVIVGSVESEDTRTTELETDYPNAQGHIDHHNNKWFIAGDNTVTLTHKSGTVVTIQPNGAVKVVSATTMNFECQGVMKFLAGGNLELHSGANVVVRYASQFDGDIGGVTAPTSTTARSNITIDETDNPNF